MIEGFISHHAEKKKELKDGLNEHNLNNLCNLNLEIDHIQSACECVGDCRGMVPVQIAFSHLLKETHQEVRKKEVN